MKDWDNYYSKHCTRFYGWLPASKEFKERKGDSKIKYLTLCDTNAIDIFMLEMEGVLQRDANQTLTGVTICEMDESKLADIFKNVNPPLRESIVKGKIQQLLLFQDTPELQAMDPDGDVRNIKIRRKLNMRRDAIRLQAGFPFDIINFDPCDSIMNPDKEMFQALDKIYELQSDIDEFLIFSTTPIHLNEAISKVFDDDFNKNIEDHEAIKIASEATLNTLSFAAIGDEHKKAAIGLGKTLIAKLSIKHGFVSNQLGIYIYKSDNGTPMMSAVTLLCKANGQQTVDWYPNEIVKIIKEMPTVYEPDYAEGNDDVKNHLSSVIQRREEIQNQFAR
ncbi:MAG: hypothetical protein JWN56_949 [Sphingobacteriales bacterium]|nr:hypothetical protein [Sphingobacteriales bacterium]